MKNQQENLNPNWITGFVDGEGSFLINIFYRKGSEKWEIRPCFQIRLHLRDLDLLKQIKTFFNNIGYIYIYKSEVIYKVQSRKDLINVIIPHFDKYLLITEKQNDFNIFKNILITENNSLFTSIDIVRVFKLKASLNKGLSDKVKKLFPNLPIVERPVNRPIISIDSYWLAGFFSAEGCFFVKLERNFNSELNYYVRLRIEIGQHSRDKLLINHFLDFFGCGHIYDNKNKYFSAYSVSKFQDINTIIIPFFKQYNIIGQKLLDFEDFCKVAKLIKNKTHLTKEGLNEILIIKSGMNKGRCI
jgi:hypothetical protein